MLQLENHISMSQKTEPAMESKKALTPWQKRMAFAGKAGRAVCIVLIFLVCGNVICNVFRLLDSFNEKEPPEPASSQQSDLPPMLPVITFDPEGRWELAGLTTEDTHPLMPMPETVTMIGSRNDRNGSPLMQLFEFEANDPGVLREPWEQTLLDFWSQHGWKSRSLEIPTLCSSLCENGDSQCYVQFFSDDTKCNFLVSHAPPEP